jgi:hypothetical protein
MRSFLFARKSSDRLDLQRVRNITIDIWARIGRAI